MRKLNFFENSFLFLLLCVPNLSTLYDTVALHLSLSIAVSFAHAYCIQVHTSFLMLSYQPILGRPLPLSPSIYSLYVI